MTTDAPRPLRGRQREVVELLYNGSNPREIAAKLGISRATVYAHIEQSAEALPGAGSPIQRVIRWGKELLA